MPNRIRKNNSIIETNLSIVFFLVFSIIYFAIPKQTFALNGGKHIEVWNDVVGIKNKESKKIVEKCWKVFQTEMDDVDRHSTLYKDFQRYFKKNDKIDLKRGCSHRVLFHWGYEPKPYNMRAIIGKCIYYRKNGEEVWFEDFDKDIKKDIIQYLTGANADRNKTMLNAVEDTWFRKRKQASAFAGIIYDVHILGDWQTSDTKPLLPPKDLAKEINRYIGKLFRSSKSKQLRKEIIKKLNHASHQGQSDPRRAKVMLDILKTDFPTVLANEYGEELKENGIVIYSNDNSTLIGKANRFLKRSLGMFGKN